MPTQLEAVNTSPWLRYVKGGFDLDTAALPYFLCGIDGGNLVELLRLPSQLPFDPQRPLRLAELFQRELDKDRVAEGLIPYLQSPQQVRFFNALTVALLPIGNDGTLSERYGNDENLAPTSPAADLVSERIGPVTVAVEPNEENLGYIAWNRDRTLPVILDGQHRFWAIKQVIDASGGMLSQQMRSAIIPVLFLLLDERAGVRLPDGQEIEPLRLCRQVFIDLNKHAEKVPLSRQIMLDDRDFAAMSMRSLISDGVSEGDFQRPVDERLEGDSRIPLCLVEWRSTSKKFDSGPYVTSALHLYEMAGDILEFPAVETDSYESARKLIDRAESLLDLQSVSESSGGEFQFDLAIAKDRIEEAEKTELPYQFSDDFYQLVAEGFRQRYARQFCELFRQLRPYRELWMELEGAGLIGTSAEPWLSLEKEGREAYARSNLQTTNQELRQRVDSITSEVKSKFPLAFQVVFQAALLRALRRGLVDEASREGLGAMDGMDPIEGILTRFNGTIVPALTVAGSVSPFQGSGVSVDGTIDYRKTRIKGIEGFCLFLASQDRASWLELETTEELRQHVESQWGYIQGGPQEPWKMFLSYCGSRWRGRVREFVQAVAEAQGETLSEGEEHERILSHAVQQLARARSAMQSLT